MGQWTTTAKWLALDPTYADGGLGVAADGGDVNDGLGWAGWVPLRDGKWRPFDAPGAPNTSDLRGAPAPGYPAVQLRLRWYRDDGDDAGASETAGLTALEKLQLDSNETNQRVGAHDAVRGMLATFPFFLQIRAFQISSVTFYVRDLFLGNKGNLERVRDAKDGPLDEADYRLAKRQAVRLKATTSVLWP